MKKAVETTHLFVPATVVKLDAEFGNSNVGFDVQLQVKSTNLKEALERVSEWAKTRIDLAVDYGTITPRKKPFEKRYIYVVDAKQCDCGQRQGACVTGMGGCMSDKQSEGESA